MLIEAKGPTAVIPMEEYERLKKIEDSFNDNLNQTRESFEKRYDQAIKEISEDENYKLVIFKTGTDTGISDYWAHRMPVADYDKLLKEDRHISVAEPREAKTLLARIINHNPL